MKTKRLETDVLIIGGGTAGCFAAYTLGKEAGVSVLIAEKANIKRSGCLAAGVNALNAYITEGHVPQDYVDYAKKDAHGIVREDLLLSMSERLNHVTKVLDDLGLVILKDENGKYVARGNRNIKINGENIKPLLAEAAMAQENVTVLERVNITDYIIEENEVGAWGFNIEENVFYDIRAKAILCATGGAAGLYRPNNPGFSRHKMWYSPFNTGAGFAMGILAGAEMTTFEMRFIALRCKDTIAPVGTIAQGVGARQMNSHGEIYETKYGLTTSQRLYGTVTENREGRGPCYLKTDEISAAQEQDLYRAYLNMAPSQTLKWLEGSRGPASENVEIERFGEPVVPDFEVPYHTEIMDKFNGIDLEAAGKVAGQGFYYLMGDIARLHSAVISYARDFMIDRGFTYCIPPYMIRSNVVTGVMSFAEMDSMMYKIEGEDLYLIGTSEHSMIGKFIDTLNDEEKLPYTLTSYSPCFRKEKGSHGIEERGVYRIHQFEKQEMIVVCKPEESMEWYEKMWKNTVDLFRSLDIPVRTLECCSGDLADLKVKSVDVEAWSPRQQKYFEVGSCSNLGDAQARRLGIRVKGKDGKYFAHTLNNTVVAPPRMLIAFLENNLQADGSVKIPEALRPYMGGKAEIR